MDARQFFTASRLLIVAGKGGVGKTTVAASLGTAAARSGIATLLVEIEGKHGLARLFGRTELGTDDTDVVAPNPATGQAALAVRTIRPDAALLDYFADHGLTTFGKTLTRMHVLDTLATSTPGLKDLIVMGKIKQLSLTHPADLIVVDAPASGHAISFLRAAHGLQSGVETGPIRRQADEVVAMLTDPARAQVLLVTLAEETPVNELVETAYALEDEVGIRLGPCVVNAVHPAPDALAPVGVATRSPAGSRLPAGVGSAAKAASRWWDTRRRAEDEQLQRLLADLPLERLTLPRRFTTRLDRDDIETLATELLAGVAELRYGDDA